MEINYRDVRDVLNIRLKQIEDDALEFRSINVEYQKILEINENIGDILIAQSKLDNYTPSVGKVFKTSEKDDTDK